MKYSSLDIPLMKTENLNMNAEIYCRRQSSLCERWSVRFRSLADAGRRAVHRYREIIERYEWVVTLFSTFSVCAFGVLAVVVFWLAVEMDNSDLRESQTTACVIKQ